MLPYVGEVRYQIAEQPHMRQAKAGEWARLVFYWEEEERKRAEEAVDRVLRLISVEVVELLGTQSAREAA